MKRLILAVLLAAPIALATDTAVLISDTLYFQSAVAWNGVITVSWPAFTANGGTQVAQGSRDYTITSGVVSISLYSVVGASPAFLYTAHYRSTGVNDRGTSWTETWYVPASGPVTLRDVRRSSTVGIGLSYVGPYSGRPTSPATNDLVLFTDMLTAGNCTTNGGTAYSLCAWSGAAWTAAGGGATNGTNGQALTSNGSGGFGTAVTLGGAATLGVGTTTGTVAAGDDSRITGAQSKATAQAGTSTLCSGSASATAATCTLTPTLGAYTVGSVINFVPGATCAGSPTTLAIDGLTAVGIYESDGTTSGTCTSGVPMQLVYTSGPKWRKLSGSTMPGGTSNQVQYNSGGTALGGFTMSGDCTIVVSTGVITCTKTNNVAFNGVATAGVAAEAGGTITVNTGVTPYTIKVTDSVYPTVAQAQAGMGVLTSVASTDGIAFTASMPVTALTAYSQGMRVYMIPSQACVGNMTLNIDSKGAKKVYRYGGTVRESTCVTTRGYWMTYRSTFDTGAGAFEIDGLSEQIPLLDGTNVYTGTQNATGAAATMPAQTGAASSKPATCTVGQIYFASDSTAGQNLWFCTTTNIWTQQGAGSTYTAGALIGIASNVISYNPLDKSWFTRRDDFPADGATFGDLNWSRSDAADGVVEASGRAVGHPGVAYMTTSGVAENLARAGLSAYYGTSLLGSLGVSSGFTEWHAAWIFDVDDAAGVGALSSVGACFGFVPSASFYGCLTSSDPRRGLQVMLNTTAPVTCSTGSFVTGDVMVVQVTDSTHVTCVDTGVAALSGTWYTVTMDSTTLGTVTGTVNGTPFSITMPDILVNAGFGVVTHTNAAKSVWLDFFAFAGKTAR